MKFFGQAGPDLLLINNLGRNDIIYIYNKYYYNRLLWSCGSAVSSFFGTPSSVYTLPLDSPPTS